MLFWCFRRRSVDPAMDRAMRSFEDATRHQCVMTLAIVSTTRRILLTAVEATDAMVRTIYRWCICLRISIFVNLTFADINIYYVLWLRIHCLIHLSANVTSRVHTWLSDDVSRKVFECMQCSDTDGGSSTCPQRNFWDSNRASLDTVYCSKYCEVRLNRFVRPSLSICLN